MLVRRAGSPANRFRADDRQTGSYAELWDYTGSASFGMLPFAMGFPSNPRTKAYVCNHVLELSRPILLVSRADGDWCFLCGGNHTNDASEYRIVRIGHAIDSDKSLLEFHDLPVYWEAERQSADSSWVRTVDSSSIRIAFLKECKDLIRWSETPEWMLKPFSSTWFKDSLCYSDREVLGRRPANRKLRPTRGLLAEKSGSGT